MFFKVLFTKNKFNHYHEKKKKKKAKKLLYNKNLYSIIRFLDYKICC
jgi:hypothetical protein